MRGLNAAMSNTIGNTHFLTLLADRTVRIMLSFACLEQIHANWFTAAGGATHVGIRRQKACAQLFAVRYLLDGKPAWIGMISSDCCPIRNEINSWQRNQLLGDSHVKSLAWTTLAVAAIAIMGCNLTGKYTVGGSLTGLRGQGLVIEDNSGNDLSLSSNGAFAFSTGIKNGGAYSVTVRTQPSNPSQTCTVNNGSGTIDKANVTNVVVSCTQAGRFAYVANQLSNNLSAYSIDSATGNLPAVNGSPFSVSGTTPVSLAGGPNGQFLYVVDNGSNDVSVYAIDNTTGALAPTGLPLPTGSSPEAVTVDPTDSFLYVANLASNSVSGYSIHRFNRLLTRLRNSTLSVGTGTRF